MTDLKQLKFTKTHEWIKVEGGKGTVGISQHAQEEVSDVVFVELPKVGRSFAQGEEAAVVESVKAAFSIYAPVAGMVSAVNESLAKDPGLINRSPYEQGWLFTLDLKNPGDSASLMESGPYEEWVKGGGDQKGSGTL